MTFILLLLSNVSFGQNNNDFIVYQEFKKYVDKHFTNKSDSVIIFRDSTEMYKVKYSCACHLMTNRGQTYRTCNSKNVIQDSLNLTLHYSNRPLIDSLSSFGFWKNIKSSFELVYNLYGEKVADSLFVLKSTPFSSIDETGLKKIELSNKVTIFNCESPNIDTRITSYNNGNLLILDIITFLTYIGNETDYGTITTYFLEKID